MANVNSSDPQVRAELIRSCSRRNITSAATILLRQAQRDPDSKVRVEIFKALRDVAGPEDLPASINLLTHLRSETERKEAEKTVAAIAHRIPDENRRAEKALEVLSFTENVPARCSLLRMLGKIAQNSALPELQKALADEDIKIKEAAIRALSEWPSPEPINDLYNVAKNSETEIHRVLALRGFIRLIGLESNRPAEKTVKMFRQAMSLTSNANEKKRVLSGLANVETLSALEMAVEYLGDDALGKEAEAAVIKIAHTTKDQHPQETKACLQKLLQTSKNQSLRRQAQDLISQNYVD